MDDPMEATRIERDFIKRVRRNFGVSCRVCISQRPKGCPTKLLPQQRCRADGYVDGRKAMTREDYLEVMNG